jgi:SAM-dependent methyltransferase
MALNVKPPRYLLRDDVLQRLLRGERAGRVLEIGYGAGDLLLELARRGMSCHGVELSDEASRTLRARLGREPELDVRLSSSLPEERFDLVLFFEVIGYWLDPAGELAKLRASHLAPDGKLLFSFTNIRHRGAAERLTGNMRCFSRAEVLELCARAGLRVEAIINYGFPLTNVMKPLLDVATRLRDRGAVQVAEAERVRKSAFGRRYPATLLASLLLNRISIRPFAWMQRPFATSDLGTGYVVVARAG